MEKDIKNSIKIVFGICGGIAAYKSAELVSQLSQKGFDTRIIMTEHAAQFITPLTLATLSKNPVLVGSFENSTSGEISHIQIMEEAKAALIAPATANMIAKLAHGIADDILTTAMLMARCPIILAPAMNHYMYEHTATQENLSILIKRGYNIIGPAKGHLACGYIGDGRMEEPQLIMEILETILKKSNTLKDTSILITAGATQEFWDPVRFISNPSTGKMGYALAKEAILRGAKVTLVSGPTLLQPPGGAKFCPVISALEMLGVVKTEFPSHQIFISAAAVSDYMPKITAKEKIKKEKETLILQLKKNPDILMEIGKERKKGQIIIGFAAETSNLINNAKEKLHKKKLDFIIANDISKPDSGFGKDTNQATIIYKNGEIEPLSLLSKEMLARIILDRIEKIIVTVK